MKSLILAAVAVLLSFASHIVAIPAPVPANNLCIGDRSVSVADDALIALESDLYTYGNTSMSGITDKVQKFALDKRPCDELCCTSHDTKIRLADECICLPGFIGWKRSGDRDLKKASEAPPRPGKENLGRSIAALDTTEETLLGRLLPQPLKFPTGKSMSDYSAIMSSLFLLREVLSSQLDLHKVCTGERDDQAFGFREEVFGKLCHPEINMPVAPGQVHGAELKVAASQWLDLQLTKENNGPGDICGGLKSNQLDVTGLDKGWIISQICG